MTNSLAEHMRSLLNNLQEFRQLACDYDSATGTILFSLADLQALSRAFNFPLTGERGGYATGEDWSQIKQILTTAGIPDAQFRGRLRVQAPHVMGITVKDDHTKTQISQALNITCTPVEISQPLTPCKWDAQTNQLLFTIDDLKKFAQNRKIPRLDMQDNLAVTNACWNAISHILSSNSDTKGKFKGRMRLSPPYVLGLEVSDPMIKDKIVSTLNLQC